MTAIKTSARDVRRLQTRERILGAAIAEFKQSGMASADVGEIVAAAGVAHGTFYFHFPTKEHVLLELESREESRVATEFDRFLGGPHELSTALTHVVQLVAGLEQRLGRSLFKELLALHYSPSRPEHDEWTDHPLIVLLVGEIERSGGKRETRPEVDASHSAMFFLFGLYGVLSTVADSDVRQTMLGELIASTVRGREVR
jgi:TetR/AcrR family transcriptional regulator, repressor for uid operon